ncbi:MAG: polysaccharide biosynthesis C-terminal domain-containing protein [Clostridium sp.]|nr:polysaccharide biosynthesis C-terminal domain-containing protein [Clostridium sp.]
MKKTNLAKNTIFLSIGTLMSKGINLLMIPLFSAWLSAEDYGMFDLFVTYILLLVPFITLASSAAIFRFAVDMEEIEYKQNYITTGLCINLCNMILAVIVIMTIWAVTGWPYAVPFTLLLIAELFNNHLQGVMRATKNLNIYSYSGVISTLGIAISVTLFVLKGQMGLNGIILGYALGYLIGELFMIFAIKYWRYLSLEKISFSIAKEMVGYAYPLIFNDISWWIINASDRILIKFFLGAAFNGVYAIACKVPNFCASIFYVFSISWQETAVSLVDSEERNIYYNHVYNSIVSIAISLCGGLLALNYFLFNFIFAFKYFEAKLYSPILISSVIFVSLAQYFGGIQVSLKRPKANGITTIIGAVVNVIINFVFIKFIGLYAAALSTIAANIVVCAIRYIGLNNDIHFRLNRRVKIFIIYYLYLLVMTYACNSLALSLVNLGLACVMFVIINKDFVFAFFQKMEIVKQLLRHSKRGTR